MSSGKRNLEMELDHQKKRGSSTKRPRIIENIKDSSPREVSNQYRPTNKPKELSSSSISSNNSYITVSSQVDVSKPEDDQIGSLLNFCGQYDFRNSSEEVNKPEEITVEIPLESDYDFWNMLDSLSSFQSNEVQLENVEVCQSSNLGAYDTGEVDQNKKWLRYLENELGLDATKDENQGSSLNNAAETLAPESFQSGLFAVMVAFTVASGSPVMVKCGVSE
ncbi:hypothetical protein SADUNF_Sadunf05G0069200 [Salix dunnii]|uniref:Uncharacterized protein n=1 Tax=Salix dunnii TaxID=1413687 RepID=A0A835KA10_9ROSI|nr:hypothetical protein SADUNF_Sadunf05G0069200 [Salix dunnii]